MFILEVLWKKSLTIYTGLLPFQHIQWKSVFSKRKKKPGFSIWTATRTVQISDLVFQIATTSCFPTKLKKKKTQTYYTIRKHEGKKKKSSDEKTTLGRPSKNSFITNFLSLYKFVLSCAKFYIQTHSHNTFSLISASFHDHKLQAVVTKYSHFMHVGQPHPFSSPLFLPQTSISTYPPGPLTGSAKLEAHQQDARELRSTSQTNLNVLSVLV